MHAILNDNDDMKMLRQSARGFLARAWPVRHAVTAAESPDELRRVWAEIVSQGWLDISLDHGETGLPMAVVLMEELGRAACPAPLIEALLARAILSDASGLTLGAEQIATGEAIPAWIYGPGSGEIGSFDIDIDTGSDGTPALNGRAAYVENAQIATHFFVLEGVSNSVAIIPSASASVRVEPTIGLTRPALANVHFKAATVSKTQVVAISAPSGLIDIARLLVCARAVGAAARGLELLSDYAREREQFGKKIGQFQAIQHKLTNCLIGIETSRLQIIRAAGEQGEPAAFAIAAAQATACQTLRGVVMELHHGFGGISFWNDHEMPRHFRRIHSDATRLGGAFGARQRIAEKLVGGEGSRASGTPLFEIPRVDLGDGVNAFRHEVRRWIEDHWQGDLISSDETRVNHIRANQAFSRALGERGWLSLSWPKAYGGQGRSAVERLVLEEELAYADAPVGWHNTSAGMIAPTLIAFGSESQKSSLVPAIGRGDVAFALGYSEPSHGSDLAGIRTMATRKGDGWTIRGQKTFTSTAGFADYCWLAARTGSAESRHGGISVFIVPIRNTPGLTIQPMYGINGHDSNTLFFDDVQVSDDALVGSVDGGWEVIVAALTYERLTLGSIGARARGYFDRLIRNLRKAGSFTPDMLDRLAEIAAQIDAAQVLAVRTAIAIDGGEQLPAHAAMLKVFASELMERVACTGIDLLGPGALLSPTVENSAMEGQLEYALRDSLLYTIGGGTNEIQRSLIALRALGLPR